MAIMPELPEVTDPAQRGDLARWVVSLRRAYASMIRQATGSLHKRNAVPDVHGDAIGAENSYCCLGIWCVVQLAAGVLLVDDNDHGDQRYAPAARGRDVSWSDGQLPSVVSLAGSRDPDLLTFVDQSDLDDQWDPASEAEAQGESLDRYIATESVTATAAELNDDHGLNFDQIADVATWRYGITPEELAAAELAPRVPQVEGPAEELAS